MYKFQELDSDDEKNGVTLDHGLQQVPGGQRLNPDELYFNDMNIQAWERRASALGTATHRPDYDFQEEDEGYFDDAGEAISAAEYEELLFQRVLDKIRIARAAGNPDVQLSPEEIEAYQNKLHGEQAPAVRSKHKRHSKRSPQNDTASVISSSSNHHASSSKPKKKKERTSLFSSKPKKEKPTSRKRAPSNVSSGDNQVAPGFVIPGPDGQPLYTPINPYQGNLARDPQPQPQHYTHPPPNPYYGGYDHMGGYASRQVSHEVPGAFPGQFSPYYYGYQPDPYSPHNHAVPPAYDHAPPEQQPSPPAEPPKLIPFPVEPYQYHQFEAAESSSSQASPTLQYVRRPSAPPSEASYTSMPRRVPVPATRTAPATTSPTDAAPPPSHAATSDAAVTQPLVTVEVVPQPVSVPAVTTSGIGKEGERKRKGKKKKG